MNRLATLYTPPTQFMPAYCCDLCGAYNKFTPGCINCEAERLADMASYFDKIDLNSRDDHDYYDADGEEL
jgi:hypothetical protein